MRDYELLVVLARNQGQFAVSTNHARITGSVRNNAILQSHGENDALFLWKVNTIYILTIAALMFYIECKLNQFSQA